MRQISIKNDRAAGLLEQITRLTGQGKTEAIIQALELYQAKLLADRETKAVIASIKGNVHPHVMAEYKGKAPSKTEIEAELGMP
jgi:hypothetical protein